MSVSIATSSLQINLISCLCRTFTFSSTSSSGQAPLRHAILERVGEVWLAATLKELLVWLDFARR